VELVTVVDSANGVSGIGAEALPAEPNAATAATTAVRAARMPTAILTLPSDIFPSSHVDAWIEAHIAWFPIWASSALMSNICSSTLGGAFVGGAVTALL
jgi:hypothetical protein